MHFAQKETFQIQLDLAVNIWALFANPWEQIFNCIQLKMLVINEMHENLLWGLED